MTLRISMIIPVLNEADGIVEILSSLQPLRARSHEVIVVDGGSEDATVTLARPLSDRVVISPRGRSRQMNAGAQLARGDILLFLHADTVLPNRADQLIVEGMQGQKKHWGHFNVALSGRHGLFRLVETLMNLRSRFTGIATGDQAIFVRRDLFLRIGGFPDISLMEDVALSRALRRHGPPLCLRSKVLTSSRRWEKNGILRTVLTMWYLRLVYAFGADPERLSRIYETLRSR